MRVQASSCKLLLLKGLLSSWKEPIPSSVRPPVVCSTIVLRTSRSSHVSHLCLNPTLLASAKWAIRFPTRYAMSGLNLRYEGQVQDEINNFIGKNIKHDYLDNSRDLNLDMTLREAEFLFSANPQVKAMAESGEL